MFWVMLLCLEIIRRLYDWVIESFIRVDVVQLVRQ